MYSDGLAFNSGASKRAVFILLVHMLHPERDPPDAGFEKGDAQILVFLHEATVDDRSAGDKLLRCVRQRVDLQEVVEMAQRVGRGAARGMKGDRDALARAFLV